jgi:hypothetical protein
MDGKMFFIYATQNVTGCMRKIVVVKNASSYEEAVAKLQEAISKGDPISKGKKSLDSDFDIMETEFIYDSEEPAGTLEIENLD